MTKIRREYLVLILFFFMATAYSMPQSMCKSGEPLSNSVIEYYTNSALNSLFTFNFIDYKKRVPTFSEYLNEDAWKEYIRFINGSHLSDYMIKKKLIIGTYFRIPAQVLNHNDRVWRVKAHIGLHLQSATEYVNVHYSVTLDIIQDLGEASNCGLKISHISFSPPPDTPVSPETNFDDRYIPYKATKEDKLSMVPKDLKQPGLDDESLIIAVNFWMSKQKNIDLSLFDHPTTMYQKGILDDRYVWRLYGPDQRIIRVTRSLNTQEGIEIQIEPKEEWYKKGDKVVTYTNDTSVPNVFKDTNNIYSIKYPLTWIAEMKSPASSWFHGPEDSETKLSLVGVDVLNYKQFPELLDFLTSKGKKYKDAPRKFFSEETFTKLKFLQGEHITIKSTTNFNLPAYSFVATYTSKKGLECKFWGVMIARASDPMYLLFLYIDDEEKYEIYLPLVKAMFNTLSIN